METVGLWIYMQGAGIGPQAGHNVVFIYNGLVVTIQPWYMDHCTTIETCGLIHCNWSIIYGSWAAGLAPLLAGHAVPPSSLPFLYTQHPNTDASTFGHCVMHRSSGFHHNDTCTRLIIEMALVLIWLSLVYLSHNIAHQTQFMLSNKATTMICRLQFTTLSHFLLVPCRYQSIRLHT